MPHFPAPRGKVDPLEGAFDRPSVYRIQRAQTHKRNGAVRTQRRVSVAADLRSSGAMPCNARGVGWFHLSQGIEVSIAAAMLHTRPLPTAPPCCIHFTSSPLSTVRTWILERDIHVQTVNELSTRIFLARYLSL